MLLLRTMSMPISVRLKVSLAASKVNASLGATAVSFSVTVTAV